MKKLVNFGKFKIGTFCKKHENMKNHVKRKAKNEIVWLGGSLGGSWAGRASTKIVLGGSRGPPTPEQTHRHTDREIPNQYPQIQRAQE